VNKRMAKNRWRMAVCVVVLSVGLPATAHAQLGWGDIYDFWRNGRTFYLPLMNGKWSFETDTIRTFTLEFSGTLTITTPEEGSFRVLIVDLQRPAAKEDFTRLIDREVRANEAIPFVYDTGSHVQLRMWVEWSEGKRVPESTLAVHIAMR
jgi:hypothetical protein